eukprot:COSAG02_NODE_2501_length_8672_cov_7.293246_6_plen_887_part_00
MATAAAGMAQAEEILKKMRDAPGDVGVQQEGCLALGNLADSNDGRAAVLEVCRAVLDAGGIALVVKAMTEFPKCEGVQQEGCLALGRLAYSDDGRAAALDAGGIALVVKAMTEFPKSEWVQRHGCLALGRLTYPDDVKAAILDAGGIALVVKAMTEFPKSEWVQENGCYALGRLACWSDGGPGVSSGFALVVKAKAAILDAGGIALIVKAMTEFPKSEGVQENGYLTLDNLARSNDGGAAVLDAGGIALVEKAITEFPKNVMLQRYGCNLVLYLKRLRASNREQDETSADSDAQNADNYEDKGAAGSEDEQTAQDEEITDLDTQDADNYEDKGAAGSEDEQTAQDEEPADLDSLSKQQLKAMYKRVLDKIPKGRNANNKRWLIENITASTHVYLAHWKAMSGESDDEQIVHGRWQGVGYDLDLQYSDLADILERYPLKARSSTSTNNATPAYINTIISGVKTADRRIAGEQQSDVDSLLWLNLNNIKGKNLSAKDRPLFEGQESVNALPPLAVATTRKSLEQYKAVMHAVSKHVGTLDIPDDQKSQLQAAYKQNRDDFDKFADQFHKAERARTKMSKLSARQESKFVPWDTIAAEVKDKVQYLLSALDNQDGMFTNDDVLQIQRAVQAVLYVLLPPQRGGTYVNMRFIDSRIDETVEELTATKSPNYVLLTPKQVQIVINGHKMDHRSQEADYDPTKDMPKLDLPVGANPLTLRLNLERCVPPQPGDSQAVVSQKMHTLDTAHVLDKYGFEPELVATVLRKYHDFLARHFPQNTKRFLFFGRKNMQPTKYEGMKTRLQTAMTNLVEKPLGGQELRTFFVSWLNEQAVPIEDRHIIADTMMHSVETAMGKYTKRVSPRTPRWREEPAPSGGGKRRRIIVRKPSGIGF